jgi:ectoine hydroxylase-related dioxygenase (phytanoyl-CoA dioxygenase family)
VNIHPRDSNLATGASSMRRATQNGRHDSQVDDRYPSIAAEMTKGSVCFFLGTNCRGAGANWTDAFRHSITIVCSPRAYAARTSSSPSPTSAPPPATLRCGR